MTAVKNYESLDYITIVSLTTWTDSFPFWELGVFNVKGEIRTKFLYIMRINFLLLGVQIGSCERRDYRKLKNTNCNVMLREEHRPLVHCNDTSGSIKRRIMQFQYTTAYFLVRSLYTLFEVSQLCHQ